MSDSNYDDFKYIDQMVEAGHHRGVVGGLWELVGQLQHDRLIAAGLMPRHTLLDVGCGSLRGGVRFVAYLEPGNYFGIDSNQSLLNAGYAREIIPFGLAPRLSRGNLLCNPEFDAGRFGIRFDFAIAISLFTHLNWCRIRLCFERLVAVTQPGSMFLASYFELDETEPAAIPKLHTPGGITTFGHHDPFHYRVSDFEQAIRSLPWVLVQAEEWGHPRAQKLLTFVRT